MKFLMSIVVSFGILMGIFGQDKTLPIPNPPIKIKAMDEIKQTLLGLEKEVKPGNLVRIKVSPLTVPAGGNTVTAIYKFALLEDGKISNNGEVLTFSERNGDPERKGSDFIFTVQNNLIKYQVIFAVTYIETKAGTTEIVSVANVPMSVYDVKVSGYVPPPPTPDVIPDGAFGLIKSVYLATKTINVEGEKRAKLFTNLANAFSSLSTKIAAGVYKDDSNEDKQIANIEGFLKDTKEAVNQAIKDADVDPKVFDGTVDVVVKAALTKAHDAGKMRKFADYQSAWAEVSEGFRFALK